MSPIKDPHLELVIVIFIVPFIVNVSTESSATKGRTLEPYGHSVYDVLAVET